MTTHKVILDVKSKAWCVVKWNEYSMNVIEYFLEEERDELERTKLNQFVCQVFWLWSQNENLLIEI